MSEIRTPVTRNPLPVRLPSVWRLASVCKETVPLIGGKVKETLPPGGIALQGRPRASFTQTFSTVVPVEALTLVELVATVWDFMTILPMVMAVMLWKESAKFVIVEVQFASMTSGALLEPSHWTLADPVMRTVSDPGSVKSMAPDELPPTGSETALGLGMAMVPEPLLSVRLPTSVWADPRIVPWIAASAVSGARLNPINRATRLGRLFVSG